MERLEGTEKKHLRSSCWFFFLVYNNMRINSIISLIEIKSMIHHRTDIFPIVLFTHSGPDYLKKSRQKKTKKNSWNQINQKKFLREIAFLTVLNFFPTSKIDFLSIFEMAKMEFGAKKIREIYLFGFTSFFFGLDFF